VVVVDKVYNEVVGRVADRASKLKVGRVKEQENWMGPVSSKSAYGSILNYVEIGKERAKATGGGLLDEGLHGWFIKPTVIGEVDPMARISQEEIFGPVLAAFRARDFDAALEIAKNTQYGLTGALFSRERGRLGRPADFHVGNLYLNRKCTVSC
jgi:1-pyrroline-5-carboxylate dehydrogenase